MSDSPALTAVHARSTSGVLYIPTKTTDAQLVDLWLHGRSDHTQRAYCSDADRFFAFVGRPLATVTLGDVQAFADSLEGLAPSSRARTLAAVSRCSASASAPGTCE